jgi:hypothetical protein
VKRLTVLASGMLLGSILMFGQKPVEIGPPEVIVHRTNPHVDGGAPTAGSTGSLNPITNHGGPVMPQVKAYLIWYGNWNQSNASDTPSGQALVRTFLSGAGGSGYYNINKTYSGVTGTVALSPITTEVNDNYSLGTRLSDADIKTIVANAIANGLPSDTGGLYFVLTSSDVAKQGFCTRYCGWHTHASIGGADIKYSFVGNSNRCLNSCAAQTV